MSIKYELIIYWSDEDQSFVVEVPELPGCMADGATHEAPLPPLTAKIVGALKGSRISEEEYYQHLEEKYLRH